MKLNCIAPHPKTIIKNQIHAQQTSNSNNKTKALTHTAKNVNIKQI